MEFLFESFFKALFSKDTGGHLTFFFGGILFTLFFLDKKLNFFVILDEFNDNFKVLMEIIHKYEKIAERNKLKKRLKAGYEDSEEFQ